MENLDKIIESVLFVAGDPIPVSDLCFKFNVKEKEIYEAVDKLNEKFDGDSGIKLLCFNNKLQLASNPDYVEYIAAVLNPIRQRNLTKATLETAAIIAYKQPITRTEIEDIRRVNSDYALNILLEHKLVEVVGRKDTVGRPTLFGTTDEFLKRFNISSIQDLPDYDELMANIQKLRENHSDSLFNRFEPELPTDEEMDKKLAEFNLNNEMDKKLEEFTKIESLVIDESDRDDVML
ncbi:MAG: SMC-Scp complex subunit ScpB [Clostridia bacterium]|nr:SMC-Scp complex subunit ScpB [Clostridia bacterium]